MTIRKLILGSLVAAVVGGTALPAAARADVDLFVNLGAPPPVYYEALPGPRAGWVWVPGYWDWRAHRQYWVAGHWVRSRPGYVYHRPRYYERDGHWYYARGGWRDSDGDGVPNRYDRSPYNPYRR